MSTALPNTWTVFLHDPENPSYEVGSYTKPFEISTLEELRFFVDSSLTEGAEPLVSKVSKYIFKKGFYPDWNAPCHAKGGNMSYMFDVASNKQNDIFRTLYEEVVVNALTGNYCTLEPSPVAGRMEANLCGISIVPPIKTRPMKVKFWFENFDEVPSSDMYWSVYAKPTHFMSGLATLQTHHFDKPSLPGSVSRRPAHPGSATKGSQSYEGSSGTGYHNSKTKGS